jgi:pyridoxine 5-phosphate synthase
MSVLSVNVDHVATVRQARGAEYPDPVEAARIAEDAGAIGITVHLRGDRRHISDRDVIELRRSVRGKLNLEMAATEEMISIAHEVRPDQITLVPERPEEVTTEGGLDIVTNREGLTEAIRRLAEDGLPVSLFVDPAGEQLAAMARLPAGMVEGYEINTDAYTRAAGPEADAELAKIVHAAAFGPDHGLRVYAGHGLTVANVGRVASIPEIEELNIGHAIISRAVLVGLATAVEEMLAAMVSGG